MSWIATPLLALTVGCGYPAGAGAGAREVESGAVGPTFGTETREGHQAGAATAPPAVVRAVEAPDRLSQDRALDAGRKPKELLSFFQIEPGQTVAELMAGGGYTAELLARVVGPEGRVYGQNTPVVLERFAKQPWTERLARPVMNNVVRVDSELEDPLPQEAVGLDAVLLVLFYHDAVWLGTDRAQLNQAVFRALRPGGVYGVVDHSARRGDGISAASTLHRIEEAIVIQEIKEAGFALEAEGDFLRNPQDTRDWNASPTQAGERRGQSDRFVLRFRKPLDPPALQEAPPPIEAPAAASAALTLCQEPRSPACTKDYRPVCATVDTGVRCVTTPCPSTTQKTYGNACTACADERVSGYVPGECPDDPD